MNKANRKHQFICLETGKGGRNKYTFLAVEPEGSKLRTSVRSDGKPEKANALCLKHLVLSLWSSGQSFWLQIQRSRVRSPALPDFLSSSGSGTGSTQPREVN